MTVGSRIEQASMAAVASLNRQTLVYETMAIVFRPPTMEHLILQYLLGLERERIDEVGRMSHSQE